MAHTTEHAMEQVDVIDGQSPAEEGNSRREELKELMLQGLWKNNPSLVQVLGLCPTLAVSSTFTNALGLGLATMVVLVCSNLAVSLVRNWVPKDIRIPVYVMIIAALVTSVQLLMNAYTYGLYQALGIFIALIVTNCVIIGRAEAYASKNPPLLAAIDGFMMGLGQVPAHRAVPCRCQPAAGHFATGGLHRPGPAHRRQECHQRLDGPQTACRQGALQPARSRCPHHPALRAGTKTDMRLDE